MLYSWFPKSAVAGLALALAACSSARFEDLNGPRYSGGPTGQETRHAVATPVSRSAPLAPVERGSSDPTRYYPSSAPYAASGQPPRASHGGYPSAAHSGTPYPTASVQPAPSTIAGAQTGHGAAGRHGAAGPRGVDTAPSSPGTAQRRPSYRPNGTARWMGASWSGYTTTTQEPFDPEKLTGAHATLPLPSYLYVTNRANGRTVLIRLNDRPPGSANGSDTVVIVSRRVADLLDFSRAGAAQVDLQYAGPAGLVSSGRHEEAFLRQQPWFGPAAASGGHASWRPPSTPAEGPRYPAPTYPRWDGTER